jgi:hypothetical protein
LAASFIGLAAAACTGAAVDPAQNLIFERHPFGIVFPVNQDSATSMLAKTVTSALGIEKNAALLAHDRGGTLAASVASTKSKPEATGRGGVGRHHA